MLILIYGDKGWIGTQFISLLEKQGYNYILGNERVDNTYLLLNELDKFKPTHIVSFIGRTHGTIGEKEYTTIDYLEQPGKLVENIKDNLFSPLSLALACKERKIHYTYLGTGCIFEYDSEHLIDEVTGFTELFFVTLFLDRLLPASPLNIP